MSTSSWQPKQPMDAIIFDCDGTLSTIEGIDELAKNNGVYDKVKAMTATAMGKTGINPELYQERLLLTKPTRKQVIELGQKYFLHQAPDAYDVIQIFKKLNKTIYLISAGLFPAVAIFGEALKIPAENIYAVDIQFDAKDQYQNFDTSSSLTNAKGKREIIEKLNHKNTLFVGDGLNDLAAADLVTRFVGYGGEFYRQNIADFCDFYISTPSMSSLLPLALTQQECELLAENEAQLYAKGLKLLQEKKVKIPEA